MRLVDIAWTNVCRRLSKVALVVLGLSIGVATAVGLLTITETMQKDVSAKLDQYGANIIVVPKAQALTLSYGGLAVSSAAYDVGQLTVADVARLGTIPNAANISVAAPKLLGVMAVQDQPVLVAGVDFDEELRLKGWWDIQGDPPQIPIEVVAGARLAGSLGLRPGSDVLIRAASSSQSVGGSATSASGGSAAAGQRFRVAGILAENGSADDEMLFIELQAAQTLLGRPEAVSLIEVSALCIACPIEDMVAQISEALPQARVTAMRQAVTLRMETVRQLGQFTWALSAIVLIIGALVVFTTMLGAVTERRAEIGVFRAIGFRQAHIVRIVLTEAAAVSAVGGLLGWIGGMAAGTLLAPVFVQVDSRVVWNPWLALGAVGAAILVGQLSSLYPAIRAARLDPCTALRSL
jgi:putative ABC transport system permease protein